MTSTDEPPKVTTIVKNRLQYPDGSPRSGEKVEFLVRAVTDWREDHTGRVVSTATTWTNADGCWRTPLLPWPTYEAERNTIVEVREGGVTTGYIQVPPPEEGAERWMRELLVVPPAPVDWRPIARLGDLHDVDRDSVVNAPDGAVLIKRGGKWVAEVPTFGKDRLAELKDVDESVSWAEPLTDTLTYLGARGWGVNKPRPSTITASWQYDDADPNTVWVGVTSFEQGKPVVIAWGDGTADTPVPQPDMYEHSYSSGTYSAYVFYDDPHDPDPGLTFANIVIPKPARST